MVRVESGVKDELLEQRRQYEVGLKTRCQHGSPGEIGTAHTKVESVSSRSDLGIWTSEELRDGEQHTRLSVQCKRLT